jgi:hypothetical protein
LAIFESFFFFVLFFVCGYKWGIFYMVIGTHNLALFLLGGRGSPPPPKKTFQWIFGPTQAENFLGILENTLNLMPPPPSFDHPPSKNDATTIVLGIF